MGFYILAPPTFKTSRPASSSLDPYLYPLNLSLLNMKHLTVKHTISFYYFLLWHTSYQTINLASLPVKT